MIETYVLGLASAEEAAEVEALRLHHPEVTQVIHEFSDFLYQQAEDNAVMPPAHLKEKILGEVRLQMAASQSPKTVSQVHDPIFSPGVSLWRFAAAASVILLFVSLSVNGYLLSKYTKRTEAYNDLLAEKNALTRAYQVKENEWASAKELLANKNMAVIKMPGIKGKEANSATVFWNTSNKEVYLMPNKLPQPEAGKQYQLWALVDGKPVDAGMLNPACSGACRMKNIPRAQAFAITLENAGGSPAPTMEAMYVFGSV